MLLSRVLSNEEYNILKPGLKYGLATRPNESNMLTYVQEIWYQIEKSNVCRNFIQYLRLVVHCVD